MFKHKETKMKKLVLAGTLLACSLSSLAWGPREQAALAGVVAGVVIAEHANRHNPPQVIYQSAPIVQHVYTPPPVYVPVPVQLQSMPDRQCWSIPVFTNNGYLSHWRLSCN